MNLKRAALALAVVFGFLVGYGAAVKAWPGVPDRDRWHGYFHNILDDQGGFIIEHGYPESVNSANEFINFLEDKLRHGSARDKTGAAFTIQTMRGASGGWSRNNPPTASDLADWESRVRYADSKGWITWYANFTFSGNTYWQGSNGGGPNPNDDAFYYENGVRRSMIFHDPTSASGVAYVIKRDCGNPLTNGYMPGLKESWSISGRTTVSNASPTPGQTVTFHHYLKNTGQTTATDISAAAYDGGGGLRTGLSSASSNTGNYTAGQERNIKNENFTIPANAAAGAKYCRLIGWDPVNSGGSRNGRGSPACVTVIIPAKLKAAIYPSPSTISAGDTVTFNPSISASNNATPVNGVTCSQVQTVVAPGGGVTSTTNVPCVTPSGNPSITVSTGTPAILKTNAYVVPDNIPVGSKVCQTITITNPVLPAYYLNYPADMTSTACAIVAKTPYVHFLGGDVWAGGGFASVNAACNNNAKITTVTRSHALADGSIPGSGVEYGAFALDKITNFGSASMALVPTSGSGTAWTFSNINPGNLGFYGAPQHCITDYSGLFTNTTPMAGGSNINVASQGSGVWHVAGGLTIHGMMPDGARQVYIVDGDVDIDSNLTYKPTFTGADKIPSLIIISKHNVHVFSAVQQIDGIIEAIGNGTSSGIFYTCWPKPAQATTSTCPNALTVNGSVLAAGLDLFRTAGAEGGTPAQQKQPAEIFNLGPEVYITNALGGTTQTTLTTNNVRELPPRF